LANSNPIMRRGIRILVAGIPDIEIVGEASDGQGLLELFEQRKPDLVILDIFLLHVHGLEVAKTIRTSYPQAKIFTFTRESDRKFLLQALY